MPKGRKCGGRQKGTPNKITRDVMETAARLGCDPFAVLCHFANGDWKALGYENEVYFVEKQDGAVKMGYVVTPEMRLTGAKEASKYMYAQRKALEVSNDPDKGFTIKVIDYTKKA